jgi:hypothetical protein
MDSRRPRLFSTGKAPREPADGQNDMTILASGDTQIRPLSDTPKPAIF